MDASLGCLRFDLLTLVHGLTWFLPSFCPLPASSQSTGNLRDVSALSSIPAVSHRGTHRTIPNPPRVRGGQRDRRLQVYHTDAQEDPALAPPTYRWTPQSLTECSVSCGKGFQYPTFRCLAQDTQELASDALCDSASKPASVAQSCNTQPCPA
ncbi:hypothetical protein chiPu_0026688, partial [Chiloscyllium punctatum]|nr:hypothetical protein [Chiloscyllium punctatum]